MARILVVDDSEAIRNLVSALLIAEGHTAYLAASGGDALNVVKRQKLDLVLCDLHMPGMSGIGLVNKLRRMDNCKNLPILMLTTEKSLDKRKEARKFGASGWISKPFKEETLINAVAKYLM